MPRELSQDVIDAIGRAPDAPGCYVFKGSAGKVLYVGKAKVLRHRIRSYLRPDGDGRRQIPAMVRLACEVEYVITSNETEALVLENNLIKLHKPRYNLMLKDDKTFVSLRIDTSHPWPRPQIVHKYRKDGADYIGPFASSTKLRETLEAVKRIFPLRRCSDHVLRNRTRVCVYHDIGMCCGPCVAGNVTPQRYREYLHGLTDLLKGRGAAVIRDFEQRMEDAAARHDFEAAAALRDQIYAMRSTAEGQRVQLSGRAAVNRDVIGLARSGDQAQVSVLLYRDDKLVGATTHGFATALPDDEIVEQFVARYYEGERPIPPEVLLPVEVDDAMALGDYVARKAGFAVETATPKRGDKLKLVQLANVNAAHALGERESREGEIETMLEQLKAALGLENLPRTMECYDISHFQGGEAVASGVCFADGKPDKSRYRRYQIKQAAGGDDFAAMEEVLERRLRRGLEEGGFPDLIVIDGGPQQLARVQAVIERNNVIGVDLIGLAKSRDKSGRRSAGQGPRDYTSLAPQHVTAERVFLPARDEPITLDQRSPELFLLMRLRDEAHRFAISYHRERKRKLALTSGLDAIPGVGPRRKRALITHFGSPARVKAASAEEIANVPGIPTELAHKIAAHFAGTATGSVTPEQGREESEPRMNMDEHGQGSTDNSQNGGGADGIAK